LRARIVTETPFSCFSTAHQKNANIIRRSSLQDNTKYQTHLREHDRRDDGNQDRHDDAEDDALFLH